MFFFSLLECPFKSEDAIKLMENFKTMNHTKMYEKKKKKLLRVRSEKLTEIYGIVRITVLI